MIWIIISCVSKDNATVARWEKDAGAAQLSSLLSVRALEVYSTDVPKFQCGRNSGSN